MKLIKVRVTDSSMEQLSEVLKKANCRVLWERSRTEADGIEWHLVGVEAWYPWALMNMLTEAGFVLVRKPDLWQFHGQLRLENAAFSVETAYSSDSHPRTKVDLTFEGYDILDAASLIRSLIDGKDNDIYAKDDITVTIVDPEDVDFDALRKDLKELGCKMRKNYGNPGYKIVVS